ncbi:DUF6340 family protein [uncultured Cyclobacterium sp.]|uniref:DUF6340 family protein n=1 Tax=uncultured Cyclobacterium sp. TaxID=453820 RepID=UPI0030EBA343|tara:strand:- start:22426 stop:23502 length:1077 start_codon:yes stop_codon:yes gene_type:complete
MKFPNSEIVKCLLFVLILMAFGSCTKNVSITRLMPAEINVPNKIQRLLIVDRTKPESQGVAIIEGILTGEMPFEVKNAIDCTVASIHQELNTSPRYEIIRANERLIGGLFSQTFPAPLNREIVRNLCMRYETDAVLTLEKFSSDFVITDKKITIKKKIGKDENAKTIEVPGIMVEGVASVQVGFRLYDPESGNILDQHDMGKTNAWSAEAETRAQAMVLLIEKAQATRFVGQMAGATYARRIAPMYIDINRTFYSKSKKYPALEKGGRYAEVDEWENAISNWEEGLSLPGDDKTYGKLCYNISLGHEVLGDLYLAKDWAARAYTQYGFKPGRTYAKELEQRMMEDEILEQQLSNSAAQ